MNGDERSEWRDRTLHPHPQRDLEYELSEWEVVEYDNDRDEFLMFLPTDEELLREEAFIIAPSDDVTDLEDHL